MELDYDGLLEAYNLRIEECMYKGKRIKELEEENKKLRDYVDNLDSENDNQAIEIEELKKERDLYKARNEELNENCFGLSKENEKLKAELEKLKSTYVYDGKQVRDIC